MKPYYEDDAVTIYHGDCREILPALRGPARLILTDPPYNVGKAYGPESSDRLGEAEYLAMVREVFQAAAQHLEGPGASLMWFWPAMRLAKGQARACLPEDLVIHHVGAWFKQEFAGDLFLGGHPAFTWEPIIWAAREREAVYAGPRGGHAGRDMIVCNSARHETEAKDHPCPKPIKAVRTAMTWVAQPGDTVIDPFMGSGTTLRAAKDIGCTSIGIEVSERYCEIAANRMAQTAMPLYAT